VFVGGLWTVLRFFHAVNTQQEEGTTNSENITKLTNETEFEIFGKERKRTEQTIKINLKGSSQLILNFFSVFSNLQIK
jgi:hypothetical protein